MFRHLTTQQRVLSSVN